MLLPYNPSSPIAWAWARSFTSMLLSEHLLMNRTHHLFLIFKDPTRPPVPSAAGEAGPSVPSSHKPPRQRRAADCSPLPAEVPFQQSSHRFRPRRAWRWQRRPSPRCHSRTRWTGYRLSRWIRLVKIWLYSSTVINTQLFIFLSLFFLSIYLFIHPFYSYLLHFIFFYLSIFTYFRLFNLIPSLYLLILLAL